ncbi:MAG: glycosyltransferase family 2 protein [Actinomycetota bacterium]
MPDVVLPVLDEAEALPGVLGRMPVGYRAIVVDNGSSDGSAAIARSFGATVVDEPRRGFGSACFAGLMVATDDIVCFMDCDGSLDPADLPSVVKGVVDGNADLVLGARDIEPGAMPLHGKLGNKLLAYKISKRCGVEVTDLGPMRAASRDGLLRLNISDRRFGWPLEMVLKAASAGWRISEVRVPYRPRSGGKSKVTGTLRGTMRAIHDMRRVFK